MAAGASPSLHRRWWLVSFALACAWASPGQSFAEEPPTEAEPPPASTPEHREEPRRAEGDESFDGGDPTAAGAYTVRTLVQTRLQLTFPRIDPALAARVGQEVGDPLVARETLKLIRDTRREHDGLRLQRVFLRATAQPSELLAVKLLIDFAELSKDDSKKALKLALAELSPLPWLTITAGLFKIPFSLLELLPIADFEFAEVGPTDDLLKDLGVAGRDVGVMVSAAPLQKKKWLKLHLGAFQGDNVGAQAWRGPGVLAGRAVSRPVKHLQLGLDGAWRPRAVDDWKSELVYQKYASGWATSGDVTVSYKRWEVRGEAVAGSRTDNDVTMPFFDKRRGDARSFAAAWAVLALRFWWQDVMIMPALRAELLDQDRQHATGGISYFTAGLNVDPTRNIRVLLDLSYSSVTPGTLDRTIDFGRYDTGGIAVIGQLQVKL